MIGRAKTGNQFRWSKQNGLTKRDSETIKDDSELDMRTVGEKIIPFRGKSQ